MISECGLYDVVADKHAAGDFSTYQRGTRVLDYCLVDEGLLDSVASCGYEPFKNNILSDHRGIFIDFSTPHFLGQSIQPLLPVAIRDISSNKPHQVVPYFKHKQQFLNDRNWFSGVDELQECIKSEEPNDALAETLYQQLIESSQHAGSLLKRHPAAE